MVTKFKIFLDPIKGREKYLNNMAEKGYRLVKSGAFFHQFIESEDKKYKYNVEYIGHLSNQERKNYIEFLDELGINSYSAPINMGKIAIGNVRFRPYADKGAMVATSMGMINREILISEKIDDGKVFETFSDDDDKIVSLKNMRKPYIYLLIFALVMAIWSTMGLGHLYEVTLVSYRPLSNYGWIYIIISSTLAVVSVYRIFSLSRMVKSTRSRGGK